MNVHWSRLPGLQSVHQLMRQHRFLDQLGEPVSNEKRALFGVIVPGRLFRQEVEHKLFEAKVWGDEPPLHHGLSLCFPLGRRQRILG